MTRATTFFDEVDEIINEKVAYARNRGRAEGFAAAALIALIAFWVLM